MGTGRVGDHVDYNFSLRFQNFHDQVRLKNTPSTRPHLLIFLDPTSHYIMVKGTKRGSPGAEEEKSPLAEVELGEEDAKKLTEIQRDLARAELVLGMSCVEM
jgi:hypothetical protein